MKVAVLRTDARVIETRGYRICLFDLPVVILQQVHLRTVQHADTSFGNRGRIFIGIKTFAGSFHADQLHIRIFDEWIEHAHRIAAAADTCNVRYWQTRFHLCELLSCCTAVDTLEDSHNLRVQMRSEYGTENVMRIIHISNPVAERRV